MYVFVDIVYRILVYIPSMYITQQLKNNIHRKRRDKQVSVIISETRDSYRAAQ